MSLRLDLAGAAMAALALILSDVTTARAAAHICESMPSRCRYNANGGLYYYPPGRRMPDSNTPPNRAAWGCGATDGKARGRSWSFPNRAAASYGALAACNRHSPQMTCHLVSCRPSVHSSDEAVAIWGTNAHQ